MARIRYTSRLTGTSEWVEKGKTGHPQNNSGNNTYQEQHSGAHCIDLSGWPDHVSVNSDEDELSLSEEYSSKVSSSSEDEFDNNEDNEDNEDEDYI